jgi:hypothetical protein
MLASARLGPCNPHTLEPAAARGTCIKVQTDASVTIRLVISLLLNWLAKYEQGQMLGPKRGSAGRGG